MDWQEITVKTTEELLDAIAEVFYDLGAGGVVIEDPKVFAEYIEAGNWDYHEIPEEILKREFVIVKGYLPVNEELLLKEEELQNRLAYLGRLFPCTLLEVNFSKVKEEDWANSWKAYYKPHRVGNLVVKPTWENYDAKGDEIIIELDPGMAFGTGTHPTTTMVLELLQQFLLPDSIVVDVGTGSGVLAVAAAKLGAQKVYAYDVDPVAVAAAQDNVILNEVKGVVEVSRGDLLKDFHGKANLISANIIADVIIRLMTELRDCLLPGGYLIASGIIKDRLQEVLNSAEEYHLEPIAQKITGEWVAVCFKR